MYLKLNRDIINTTNITKPFEAIELGVYKNIPDSSSLPCIRLYFSNDIEELQLLDFTNSIKKAVKYVEFIPKSRFTYHQIKQIIKSDFMFCRVIMESDDAQINKNVDFYFDTIK